MSLFPTMNKNLYKIYTFFLILESLPWGLALVHEDQESLQSDRMKQLIVKS